MTKVILGITMSLDGFINDANGDVGALYPDFVLLHETEMLQELIRTTGAVVMGRQTYDMGHGDYTGYEYQVPIFVLTHNPPETVTKGQNDRLSFTFVTDSLASAIAQAKAAARDRDVTVIGSANIAQQCINGGFADELEVGIVSLLLGDGLRLFEHLGQRVELERTRVLESPGRIDLSFRIVK